MTTERQRYVPYGTTKYFTFRRSLFSKELSFRIGSENSDQDILSRFDRLLL